MLPALIIISTIFDAILLSLYTVFSDLNDNYHYKPNKTNKYKIISNILFFLIILVTSFICGLLIAGGIK